MRICFQCEIFVDWRTWDKSQKSEKPYSPQLPHSSLTIKCSRLVILHRAQARVLTGEHCTKSLWLGQHRVSTPLYPHCTNLCTHSSGSQCSYPQGKQANISWIFTGLSSHQTGNVVNFKLQTLIQSPECYQWSCFFSSLSPHQSSSELTYYIPICLSPQLTRKSICFGATQISATHLRTLLIQS